MSIRVISGRSECPTPVVRLTPALVANDVGNNPRLRTLAMVHVAMSDAINTVQNHYTRVLATLPAAPGVGRSRGRHSCATDPHPHLPGTESQDRGSLRGIGQGT